MHRRPVDWPKNCEPWNLHFRIESCPITTPIAKRWAENNVPNPLPLVDGLLAATAQEHGLILVTRNTRDVAPSGVATLNPFEKVT
ncbi:MAG: PIN domain-containing protein [Acidiferrobacter thiooxydans]